MTYSADGKCSTCTESVVSSKEANISTMSCMMFLSYGVNNGECHGSNLLRGIANMDFNIFSCVYQWLFEASFHSQKLLLLR